MSPCPLDHSPSCRRRPGQPLSLVAPEGRCGVVPGPCVRGLSPAPLVPNGGYVIFARGLWPQRALTGLVPPAHVGCSDGMQSIGDGMDFPSIPDGLAGPWPCRVHCETLYRGGGPQPGCNSAEETPSRALLLLLPSASANTAGGPSAFAVWQDPFLPPSAPHTAPVRWYSFIFVGPRFPCLPGPCRHVGFPAPARAPTPVCALASA